jgi:hypothetical protein
MPLASIQCYDCQQMVTTPATARQHMSLGTPLLCGEVATTDLDEDNGTEGEEEEFDFSFHQTDAHIMIDPKWILLDRTEYSLPTSAV